MFYWTPQVVFLSAFINLAILKKSTFKKFLKKSKQPTSRFAATGEKELKSYV